MSTAHLPPATDLSYADFGRRFRGWFVDVIISFALMLVFVFIVIRPCMIALMMPAGATRVDARSLWAAMDPSHKALVLLMWAATTWSPPCLYYALLESGQRSATIGKRVVGLTALRSDGTRVSFLRAATRFSIKWALALFPFGFITVLPIFSSRSQGLHDRLSDVVVVHRR